MFSGPYKLPKWMMYKILLASLLFEVVFYHISCSDFLVLTTSIAWRIISEKEIAKVMHCLEVQ
jgi:hypothetical protein